MRTDRPERPSGARRSSATWFRRFCTPTGAALAGEAVAVGQHGAAEVDLSGHAGARVDAVEEPVGGVDHQQGAVVGGGLDAVGVVDARGLYPVAGQGAAG